jgi:hypothetical protein
MTYLPLAKKLVTTDINHDDFMKSFEYPFSYLPEHTKQEDRYNYNRICLTLFNNKMKSERINMSNVVLPRDITRVYWFSEGVKDEKPWQFIGRIMCNDKEKYIYYIGECDYTGFSCQGDMKLYVTSSILRLLKLAVPRDIIRDLSHFYKI